MTESLVEYRISKMTAIANEVGVKATIKNLKGKYYAHVKGISFIVTSYTQFRDKCEELKDYKAPEPMNLTERLLHIEAKLMRKLGAIR